MSRRFVIPVATLFIWSTTSGADVASSLAKAASRYQTLVGQLLESGALRVGLKEGGQVTLSGFKVSLAGMWPKITGSAPLAEVLRTTGKPLVGQLDHRTESLLIELSTASSRGLTEILTGLLESNSLNNLIWRLDPAARGPLSATFGGMFNTISERLFADLTDENAFIAAYALARKLDGSNQVVGLGGYAQELLAFRAEIGKSAVQGITNHNIEVLLGMKGNMPLLARIQKNVVNLERPFDERGPAGEKFLVSTLALTRDLTTMNRFDRDVLRALNLTWTDLERVPVTQQLNSLKALIRDRVAWAIFREAKNADRTMLDLLMTVVDVQDRDWANALVTILRRNPDLAERPDIRTAAAKSTLFAKIIVRVQRPQP